MVQNSKDRSSKMFSVYLSLYACLFRLSIQITHGRDSLSVLVLPEEVYQKRAFDESYQVRMMCYCILLVCKDQQTKKISLEFGVRLFNQHPITVKKKVQSEYEPVQDKPNHRPAASLLVVFTELDLSTSNLNTKQ